MNILMVNPRSSYFDEGEAVYKRISFPMGLMQLSSAIKNIKVNNEDASDWEIRDQPREDVSVSLIDAAAEGFGNEDGEGDPLVVRDNRKLRLFGLSEEEIITRAKEVNPEVIFISSMASKHLDDFYAMADLIRANFPEAIIVAGGIAVSQLDKPLIDANDWDNESLQTRRKEDIASPHAHGVDIVALGEAEITASMIVDAAKKYLSNEEPEKGIFDHFSHIPNLRIAEREGTIRPTETKVYGSIDDQPTVEMTGTGFATLTEDELNRLPFPDLDLIDPDLYGPERAHYGTAKGKWIELFTSRGCSRECRFCATKQFFGQYRTLSDQRLSELLDYYRQHGFDEVCIEDDSILDDPDRATRIFELIKEHGFNQFAAIGGIEIRHLLFKSNGEELFLDKSEPFSQDNPDCVVKREQLETIKPQIFQQMREMGVPEDKLEFAFERRFSKLVDGHEIIKSMAENGCYRIYLAIESANESTREFNSKGMDFPLSNEDLSRNRSLEDVIDDLNEHDIEAHGGIMMGNPKTEGIDELMNNVRKCQELMEHGLTRVALWPYIFLPGSNLSGIQNLLDGYARIRFDFGNVGHNFDLSNIDSLEKGWTAEELITIVQWANKIFSSGEGKNWGKGESISKEELEYEIAMITDPEILYRTTALRLLKEGGKALLDQYHTAIEANENLRKNRGIEGNLPEYAYAIEKDDILTETARTEIIQETQTLAERYIAELNESSESDIEYEAQYDIKAESAISEMELVMRAPLITER